jgi:hypothetical protein
MRSFRPRRCLPLLLLLALWSGACSRRPQLGPTDGAGLPPRDLERVKVGEPAPDFTLENKSRQAVTLSDFRGEKHVLLVFYRGHW